MRVIRVLFIISILSVGAFSQVRTGFDISNYGVTIAPDKRVMTTLAAIDSGRAADAGGTRTRVFNTQLSEAGEQFRKQVDSDLAGMPDDLRTKIGAFLSNYKRRHPKTNDNELLAPFISMAYTLSPAPELSDPVVTMDLPGELLDVLDFAPLVREFYRRSGFSEKLDQYSHAYLKAADTLLRTSARNLVSDTLDYLHTKPQLIYTERVKVEVKSKKSNLQTTELREHNRKFVIVPEMFAAGSNITFLNVRDDYYLILPPDKDLEQSEARRAFLQFVIDPLVLTSSQEMSGVRDGIKMLLDERRKSYPSVSPDPVLAVVRSLTAAIEARQDEYTNTNIAIDQARQQLDKAKTEAERKLITDDLEKYKRDRADETAARLSDAYERGAVMAFYFADQLHGTEDSGFNVAASIKEMISSFDASKEGDRLAQNAEARKRAIAARASRSANSERIASAIENPVTTKLIEIQRTIDSKNYDKAAADLKELSADNPNEPRIYYNIGRVASLAATQIDDPDERSRKLMEARAAYSNVIRTRNNSTPVELVSLTFVALGRIYEFFDQDEYAVKLYDEAIKIGDVTGGAYKEALAAKQTLLQNTSKP